MRVSIGSTAVAILISLVAIAWVLSVPAVLSTSSFIAVLGLVMGFGWVILATYSNARPASSLAQTIHDMEQTRNSRTTRGAK